MTRIATHTEPIWRDRSDHIVRIAFGPGDTNLDTEQLWARRVGPAQFEICCIPFFVYDLALGDVVEVGPENDVTKVVSKSGRFVFGAYVGESDLRPADVEALAGELEAQFEWFGDALIALDARDVEHAELVAARLQDLESQGRLDFETGALI